MKSSKNGVKKMPNRNQDTESRKDLQNVPRHLAIIPDGNRRWAKINKKSIVETYDLGIRKIRDVAEWCKENGIKTLTMWGLSTDNLKRSNNELTVLFNLFKKYLLDTKMYENKKEKEKIKVKFYGRLGTLPIYIRKGIKFVENSTKDNGPYRLNLLLGYGGREEIIDAVNKIMSLDIKKVDEKEFSKYLYGIGKPDLVIRTSNTMRLSGFLLWEVPYAELYFSDKLWPDFSKIDFLNALKSYKKRERKFGK